MVSINARLIIVSFTAQVSPRRMKWVTFIGFIGVGAATETLPSEIDDER
jgi:hypothetical protein